MALMISEPETDELNEVGEGPGGEIRILGSAGRTMLALIRRLDLIRERWPETAGALKRTDFLISVFRLWRIK